METRASTHPSADKLRGFEIGQLDDADAVAVMSHLDSCSLCQKEVAAVTGDYFLDRLREAQSRSGAPPSRQIERLVPGLPAPCGALNPDSLPQHEVTVLLGPASSGVLSSLAESLGGIPKVLLRDTDSDAGPGPVVQPGSSEIPDVADRSGRLQFLGEIARGGMGAVLKGRDPDLGRDLAVKVLLEDHRNRPEFIRRFIEEAQIAGQLQHPGIVPVYELGAFADRRPYFAMKLVKGRTLASLLAHRKEPADELPRLLGIFEQVAQTVAYAHARGVIHRDLKPSNIMVGSFGEVQVMD
jgi:hypothetical protein